MSDKSGISRQVISLPKGGGALQGLGEKFAPDLHTGTGNFSVPIAVPPGRNNFQPELKLAYSTGAGNGPFGLGWSLSVPGVSRRTARGVPRYHEDQDVYVLSGAEDLVPVQGSFPGTVRYQPRTEGLFAVIERHRNGDDDYWEVRTKDGLVTLYGTPGRRGDDPATLTDPDHPDKVFSWRVTETWDPLGNRIVHEYRRDEGALDGRRWRQPLLQRIRYADFEDATQTRYLASVTFVYDDEPFADEPPRRPRPDPFSDYRAGFEIRTTRRCTRIVTATHAGVDQLVRSYRLEYDDERRSASRPGNGVSLLRQIQVLGHDDAGQAHTELPPIELGYTRFEPHARRDLRPVEGLELPPGSLGRPEYELADLTGNGLPDILEMNGVVRYWANLGGGRFDRPRPMADAPAGLALADPGVQLLDADGDGRIDLLVTTPGVSGYFPLQHGSAGWDRGSFRRHASAPTFSLDDPDVKLVDLDGDGVTDALRTGTRLEHYFNDPALGWHAVRTVERGPLESFPDVMLSDPHVRLADMSGDGLQDLVRISDGHVEYWPNLGHGNWGRRVSMRSSPRLPTGYDPRRILLGDVDGDGAADLLYVDDTRVLLWVNRSGNGWSEPVEIAGTPAVTDIDAVRLVDLLGSGVAGVLWSADDDGAGRPRSFFLDLTGGGKPYLLDRMDNQLGAITEVRYAPSTAFRLADEGDPRTRWRTPLPFPLHVVARIDVTDTFSETRLTSELRYHHGYWDGAERELRGFGVVEQLDAETFLVVAPDGRPLAPPTSTKTWFHLGPIGPEHGDWAELDLSADYWPGDPSQFPRHPELEDVVRSARLPRRARRDALRALRGQVLRTELYAYDGSARQQRPYTVTETWLSVRDAAVRVDAADDDVRPAIFFGHVRGQRTTQWERGDDPLTRFVFADDHDRFGQPCLQTQIACPRGWRSLADRPGQAYLATRTRIQYAAPTSPALHLRDRAASVTTRELVNDGRLTVADVLALPDAAAPVLGQVLSFYDGGAYVGLPLGVLGEHGALVRSERLALTDRLLEQAYGAEVPPYLTPGAALPGYPADFAALLPSRAGYIDRRDAAAGDGVVAGLFVAVEQCRYDFHDDPAGRGRGLIVGRRDPLGHETTIGHDAPYGVVPVLAIDPAGTRVTAEFDYRVLQIRRLVDGNGNTTEMTYTPLGMPASTQLRGASGDGDQDRPGLRFRYDLMAFVNSPADRRQPISVATIQHVYHDRDTDVPLPARDEVIESRQYSDGFGRMLQTRTQGEDVRFGAAELGGGDAVLPVSQASPGGADVVGRVNPDPGQPSVVVSGWQRYDNKGRVVETYEPYFAAGWDYAAPRGAELGQRTVTVHDPLGRAIRTIGADGSEQRIVTGVPAALDAPDQLEPTPWETWTYDAGDNAGRTHPAAVAADRGHHDTPASVVIDALGRPTTQVARNGVTAADALTTRLTHDLRGNVLTITDPVGRLAFAHVYDLLDRPLRLDGIDTGGRTSVLDAAGHVVELRDGKGALRLTVTDALGRPSHVWARDRDGEPVTLRERLVYGDDPTSGLVAADIARGNLRGRLYRHHDEAGRLTITGYDLRGNVREQVREVIDAARVMSVFATATDGRVEAYRVDWQSAAGATPAALEARAVELLDGTRYVTTTRHDALGRIKALQYPSDPRGRRRTLQPTYNRAGALEAVEVDGEPYVERIAYNAKGQRILVAYGNGLLTRMAYDPRTFRLVRLRTESFVSPAPMTYRPRGEVLQDLGYEHDLTGNVRRIQDRAPQSGLPTQPDRLDRVFTYDPLYRLSSATGRECDLPAQAPPWADQVGCSDVTRTRAYTQRYAHDAAGNLTALDHAAAGGVTRREYGVATGSNRVGSLTVGQTTYAYEHDAAGNLIRENLERHLEWDHGDRLRVFRIQTPAGGAPAGSGQLAEPSVHAHYLYDSAGQRVMKLVRNQGGAFEVSVYVGGVFEHHRWREAGQPKESTLVHVMDSDRRLAQLRAGDRYPGDGRPDVQYCLGDHLGSSHVTVGGARATDGALIDREEYYPYGETSFGSFARKRYRFGGKERDEESGLYYVEARYYAPALGRWTSCDPKGRVDGLNLYAFVKGNPLSLVDRTGESGKPPPEQSPDGPDDPQKLQDRINAAAERMDDAKAEVAQADAVLDKARKKASDAAATVEGERETIADLTRRFKGGDKTVSKELIAAHNRLRKAEAALPAANAAVTAAEEALAAATNRGATAFAEHQSLAELKSSVGRIAPGASPKSGPAKLLSMKVVVGAAAIGAVALKKLLALGVKAVPLAGGGYTFYATEGSVGWKALNAVAGEIGAGPVDLQMLGEGIGFQMHLAVENPASLLLLAFPPAHSVYTAYKYITAD